ncbi:radical SAM/SPASM domain-containing protein [Salidesulfovibrio brasiliensis]|uniref:radical SAM/SPASM domain-containing protein n=1 Tax=Salidesulfovibrio brasiliensis TaxID=221711 RepID=UPI0006D0D61B|nr:radical SAM protein [Salidesulfovibrio brasiliensis]
MKHELDNTVEQKNHLRRFSNDNVLQTIYDALPDEKKKAFVDYREKWTLADKERIDLPFPLCISLELISNCNLHCIHCIRSKDQWKEKAPSLFTAKRMGWDTYKRIVDECSANNMPSIWLGCSGEALLEKQLCEMFEYAHEKGIMDTILTTNGTLLTSEIIDRLLAIPVTRINISIDAFSPETYKVVRGHDLKKLTANIDYIIQRKEELGLKLPVVRVTFIDMPQNTHEAEAFVNYWKEKVDLVDVQKLIDLDAVEPPDPDTVEPFHCCVPWRLVDIMANGDVVPCNSFFGVPDLVIGNIHEKSIKEIWDSEEFRQFREDMKNDKYKTCCMTCFASLNKDS